MDEMPEQTKRRGTSALEDFGSAEDAAALDHTARSDVESADPLAVFLSEPESGQDPALDGIRPENPANSPNPDLAPTHRAAPSTAGRRVDWHRRGEVLLSIGVTI